jgi:DnaJ family protein A protein 2
MDDLFSGMFGGGGGGGFGASFSFDTNPGSSRASSSNARRRGQNTDIGYEVTLEEAYKGKRVVMDLQRDRLCGHCKGQGGRKGAVKSKCTRCGGKGSVVQDRHVSGLCVG